MPATFYIKQNDRLPSLQATLVDGQGNPVNLSGGTVTFNMRDSTNALKVTAGACNILNAAGGVVSYPWAAADTNTAGTFSAEFELTLAGLTESFPNNENITVVITSELN